MPWNAEGYSVPDAAQRLKTMLTDEESRLLYWLARDYADGSGAICDLGCFAGGSTARMAAGVADAGRETPVHAYDFFSIQDAQKERYLYPAGVPHFDGEDMLDAVKHVLSPWSRLVRLHKGDIRDATWSGDPIEILFVDAAKTPELADLIAHEFFPAVMPGRSVVVQQDYLHWRQPWIPAQMELLCTTFEIVAWCQLGTVAFRPTVPVTPQKLAAARTTDLPDQEMIDLIKVAIRRFPRRPQTARLATSIMAIEDNPGVRIPYKMDNSAFSPERVKAILDSL